MASKAGFIITLIGGITQLLGALVLFGWGALFAVYLAVLFPALSALSFLPGIWLLAAGIITIWASTKMKKDDPAEVKKGGIISLITGILAPNLIVIIGAIIALVQSSSSQPAQ